MMMAEEEILAEFWDKHGRDPNPIEQIEIDREIQERVIDMQCDAIDYWSDVAKGK